MILHREYNGAVHGRGKLVHSHVTKCDSIYASISGRHVIGQVCMYL